MDKYFDKCEMLLHCTLFERLIMPAGLYIGHLLTALFFVFTTADSDAAAPAVVLGTLFFGWFTSILVWLVWMVTNLALAFCLVVAGAIVSILEPPIAGIRQRLRP